MNRRLESGPGRWRYPTNDEHCCIYRVPHRLRRVNPEAYTPQLVLIGPLHHSLKYQAPDITNTKLMGYLNMEEHKEIYLLKFTRRLGGQGLNTIDEFREIIKEEEGIIRASYSESTAWINSADFVEMILLDSVFIIEFLLRSKDSKNKLGDLILDQPCLSSTVYEDLILLENQLPYFILEKLFDHALPRIYEKAQDAQFILLRDLFLNFFVFEGKISDESKFRHVTDLLRCVRVKTLDSEKPTKTRSRCLPIRMETDVSRESTKTTWVKSVVDHVFGWDRLEKHGSKESTEHKNIKHMYNAEKLYSAGVKFVPVKDELSIDVTFENGSLKIPSLLVGDEQESILRNIMALEQCHYPFEANVCNYVKFLDFLIDTDKDVDLLMENGILHNWIGEQSSVAEMVNKLSLGVTEIRSCYSDIASKVNAYYENPVNRSRAVLGRMYFGNIWTGTATVAATLLLVMTLIQTVSSIIQVTHK